MSMLNNYSLLKQTKRLLFCGIVLLWQTLFSAVNAAIVDQVELSFDHNGDSHWVDVTDLATTGTNQYFVIYVPGAYNINIDKVHWANGDWNVDTRVAESNVNWKDGTAVAGMDNAGDTYLIYGVNEANLSDFKIQYRSWNHDPASEKADFIFYIVENPNDIACRIVGTGTETGVVYDVTNTGNATSWFDNILDVEENQYVVIYSDAEDQNINFDGVKIGGTSFDPRNTVECTMYKYTDQAVITSNDLNNVYAVYRATESGSLSIGYRAYQDGYQLKIFTINDFCAWDKSSNFESKYKPKVTSNYLFAPPGTEINVTASWSGTDELANPEWAFEYSTDGTNWTASPLEYINENVLTFDMQLQNVYVRAKITNATADMTSEGRDVSAAVLINGVNNNSAACENSASQTLLWERFDLTGAWQGNNCYEQKESTSMIDYAPESTAWYDDDATFPTTAIRNNQYAIVRNPGYTCLGGNGGNPVWFINDYDHTGDVTPDGVRQGGLMMLNLASKQGYQNAIIYQREFNGLPAGTKLYFSMFAAYATKETGRDAAVLELQIQGSNDGTNWNTIKSVQKTFSGTGSSKFSWEELNAGGTFDSGNYDRLKLVIYNRGTGDQDNGEDFVIDDILFLACRPQLEWNNITSPLNHDQDAFLLQNSKESWARAFGENKTYFMVVEIADNDGNTYYTKAEVNYGGTCTTSYPCISAEDVPVTVPFTVGDAGNVYDSNGQKVGDDFSLDKSKLYTLQAKIYTNEAAYNADNAGSAGSVIISGQSTKVKMRPSLPIKILACENRDGSAIYNGTGVQTDLETAITNSINDTDVSVTMYEGEWNYDDGGYILSTPVLEVSIDAQHNPTFNYNTSKKIEINNGTFEKVYTLIWKYDLGGVETPYSAQPVTITLNDLPKDLSVATAYTTQCSNLTGAVTLTENGANVVDGGTLQYQWIAGDNANDFADNTKIISSAAALSLTGLAAGTQPYTVRVRNNNHDNNHCSTDLTQNVTIYAIPEEATLTATVNSEDVTTVCVTEPNNTINLTTAITSPTIDMAAINQQWKYEWSIVSGPAAFVIPADKTVEATTANTATLSLTGVPFGNYTFKVKISNGTAGAENCASIEKTIEIKVLERPTVIATATGDITANVTTACVEGSTMGAATLTANVNDITGFGQSLTFDWNLTGAATQSELNSTSKTWNLTNLAAGSYTVTCKVKNTEDCTIDLTATTFTIYPKATNATLTATAGKVCLSKDATAVETTTIDLSATVSPATLPAGLEWVYVFKEADGNVLSTQKTNTYTVTNVAPGAYTYLVSIYAQTTSANVQNPVCDSLTAHNETQVKVYYTPVISTINADPEKLTCTVKEAVLTAVASDAAWYEWSNGKNGATKDTIHVSSANEYSLVVYSDAAKTCSSARVNKIVSADANMPEINIISNPNVAIIDCNNPEIVLTADIDAKGGTIQNIEWSNGKSGADADTIHVSNANTYTATVTLTNGCSASASKDLTKNVTKPIINISNPDKLTCAVLSTTLQASGTPATYAWTDVAGEPAGTGATYVASVGGVYTVTATSTENGCTNTKDVEVQQDITTPAIQSIYSKRTTSMVDTISTTYCAQDASKTAIAGVYFGLNSSENGVTYQLYNGGKTGTPQGAAIAGTGEAISFGQLAEGTYAVLATKTATGCPAWMQFTGNLPAPTEEVTITKLDNPTITLTSANNKNCVAPFNGNVVLSETNANQYLVGTYDEYGNWSYVSTIEPDTVYNHLQSLTDGLVYVRDAFGCVNSATASLTDASETPTAFAVSGDGEKCEGTTDELTVTLSGSQTSFTYTLAINGDEIADTETEGTGNALTWTVAPDVAGTYIYTVRAFNAETGCENNMTGSATVNVHPYPTVPNVIPLKSEEATVIQNYYYEDAKCNGTATGVINLSTEYIRVVNDVISADSVTWKDALNNVVTDLTKLAKGTYTLYATNFGCVSTATVEIGEPETLVIPTIAKYTEPQPGDLEMTTYYKDALCNGDESGQLVVAADFTVGGTGEVTFTLKDAQDNEVVPDVNPTAADTRWTTLAKGTYTLTATDANGCDATQTVTIGEPEKLTISAAVDTTGLAPADWADNVVFINETCAGSANGEISVGENAITGGTPFVSAAAQYNVELFKKNENDNNYTFVDNVDGVIENLKPGVYKLKATDANGCADSISVTIAAAEPVTDPEWNENNDYFRPADPQDADSKASFEVCAADNKKVALEVLMNRGNEHVADTIMWAYGNFVTKTWIGKQFLAIDSIDIAVPDTFIVTAKYITPLGCESKPAEVEFRINRCTDLVLTLTADKTEYCEDELVTYRVTLRNNASVDAVGVKVKVELPENLTIFGNSTDEIDFETITAGSYKQETLYATADNAGANLVTYSFVSAVNGVTYANKEAAQAESASMVSSFTFTINQLPDVLDVDEYTGLTYCINETGVKDLSELEADEDTWSLQWGTEYIDAESDWNWSATVPVISTAAQTSPNGQQIAVRQVSDKGCIGEEAFITYIVNPNPQVSLNNVTQIKCFRGQGEDFGSIEVTTDAQTGVNYTFVWTNKDDAQFISREVNRIENLLPGEYHLTVRNEFGCADSSFVATINKAPDSIAISLDPNSKMKICGGTTEGKIVVEVVGGTGDYTYEWFKGQQPIPDATGKSLSDLTGGAYYLEVSDELGCTNGKDFVINQPNGPIQIETFVHSDINCANYGIPDTAIVVVGTADGTAVQPVTYEWYNSNESGDVIGDVISENTMFKTLEGGYYHLQVTDFDGCQVDTTYFIYKPESFLNAVVDKISKVSCYGYSDGAVEVSVTGGTPKDGGYIFEWSNGDTEQNLSGVKAGYYDLKVSDALECFVQIQVEVKEPEPLEVGLLHAKLDVCNGIDDGFITTSVQGGVAPYTYTWSNGENTSGIYDLAGGVYSLTVTDANNCPAEFEEEVQGYDPIEDLTINVASSDPDNRVLPGDKITFTANASRDIVRYDWDYTGWGEETTFEEVFYKDKIFTLWASDGICPEVKVELPIEVVWPTIFSPYDANGLNDEFLSPNADGKEERANWYIIVFNRYGQKVYEGKCGWDGTYKGKTALPGTYYYTIKFPNGESHDGTVEVSRQD